MSITKAELRSMVNARLHSLTQSERQESDRQIVARFLEHPWTAEAGTIFAYYGVGTEIQTTALLRHLLRMGKRVLLPRTIQNGQMDAVEMESVEALAEGMLGIPEPKSGRVVPKGGIDLILVPNLCCDRRGYRLGQGGGYYDRYLADYSGRTIALCRSVTLFDSLLVQSFDQPVQRVLTEREELVRSNETLCRTQSAASGKGEVYT